MTHIRLSSRHAVSRGSKGPLRASPAHSTLIALLGEVARVPKNTSHERRYEDSSNIHRVRRRGPRIAPGVVLEQPARKQRLAGVHASDRRVSTA